MLRGGPASRAGQVLGVLLVAAALAVALAGGPERLASLFEGDGGCEHGDRVPGPGDVAAVREATLCLVNRERQARGLQPLVASRRLTRAAQRHSEDMGERDFFAHDSPDGAGPAARIHAAGVPRRGTVVGENLAWGAGREAVPRRIVEGWMASPGHRANILHPAFTRAGIGVGFDPPASARGEEAAVYTNTFSGPAPGT